MHSITVPHGQHEHICACAGLNSRQRHGVVAHLLSLSETASASQRIAKGSSEKNLRRCVPYHKEKERLWSTYHFDLSFLVRHKICTCICTYSKRAFLLQKEDAWIGWLTTTLQEA